MKVFSSVDSIIGNTPLLEPKNLINKYSLYGKILLKLECFNPAGSAKDRVAKFLIDDAEIRGVLRKARSVFLSNRK